MATVEQIYSEIQGFTVEKDVISVEFDEFILEVDINDLQGLEINKDTLAKVIHEKYQDEE